MRNNNNIGLLISDFEIGGAQKSMVRYANTIYRYNHSVTVFVLNNNGILKSEIDLRIPIIDIGLPNARKAIFSFNNLVKEHKINILISTLIAPNFLSLIVKIIFNRKLKVIIREATNPSLEADKSIKDRILHSTARFLYRKSDKFIAVSNGVKNELIGFYNIPSKKIAVIYNPIINSSLKSSKISNRFKTQALRLLFIGRIDEVKRIEIQLEALKILRDKFNINAILTLVGDHTSEIYKKKLLQLINELHIEELVNFVGRQREIENYFKNNDILLLTSKYEGLPSVLVEGLYYGINIISCDCPYGPSEVLNNGEFGVLIPNSKCNAMALAIQIAQKVKNEINYSEVSNHLVKFSQNHFIIQLNKLLDEV